jgi:hypothetical protein
MSSLNSFKTSTCLGVRASQRSGCKSRDLQSDRVTRHQLLMTPTISIIEGYLMIICATLPSFRQFLRHVAPKMLGQRSRQGHFPTIRGSNDVVTIGSALMNRRTYQKFDEAPYGLNPIPSVDTPSTPRCTSVCGKSGLTGAEEPGSDGIIQTRTVSVTIGLAQ